MFEIEYLAQSPLDSILMGPRSLLLRINFQLFELLGHSSLVHIWEHKLKRTKASLKEWVKSVYKYPSLQIASLLKKVETYQENMEQGTITGEILQEEQQAFQQYHNSLRVEEETWRLKS
jgi:hypothetical protein